MSVHTLLSSKKSFSRNMSVKRSNANPSWPTNSITSMLIGFLVFFGSPFVGYAHLREHQLSFSIRRTDTASTSSSSSESLSKKCSNSEEIPALARTLAEVSDLCTILTKGSPQNLAYEYVSNDGYLSESSASSPADWHQRFALAAFYHSITNDPGDMLSNWAPTSPSIITDERDWNLVDCDGVGAVTSLDFYYQELEGTIPSELAGLSALTYLNLYNNPLLVANNLEALGTLKSSLTELYLGNNQLSSVPSQFGELHALTDLSLYNNQLETLPTELGYLSNLKTLSLHKNPLPLPLPSFVCDLWSTGSLVDLRCGETTITYGADCCTDGSTFTVSS